MSLPNNLPQSYAEAMYYDKRFTYYTIKCLLDDKLARRCTVADLKDYRLNKIKPLGPVGQGNRFIEKLRLKKEYLDVDIHRLGAK